MKYWDRAGPTRRVFALTAGAVLVALVSTAEHSQEVVAQETNANWILELFDHRGEDIGQGTPMWGYSALVRYNGITILFDGGTSAKVLEHNARTYGVDLREVDLAVLSHAHGDHTAGLDYLLDVNPSVPLFVPEDGYLGYNVREGKENHPGYRYRTEKMQFVGANLELEDGVHLIFTTSPHTGYFSRYPPNEDEPRLHGLPELSLALETESGDLVVISGCSHSGIERIVEEAKRATDADVALVTGGFHLGPYSREIITQLARMMKDDLGVAAVAPTHCTGDVGMAVFQEVYGESCLKAGLGTRISFPY